MNPRKWSNVELTAGTLLFLFCTVTALTQPVNPFPEDGCLASRSRSFEHQPGGDNHTPIGVPAFFYAATYLIRTVAGLALEQEFYFDSLLHHLLLFATVVLAYLSHRSLGLRRAGIVAAGILAVFIESTLLPQAFWSENLTVCLMSAVLFVGLCLLQNTQLSERRFRLLTILFGLLLTGLVVTRLVPILILPGIILLLRTRLPRQLAGALAFFLSRKAALSRTLLFFAYVFLTGLYVSAQIEEPDGRYVLLYLPALALLASNSVAMLVDVARSAWFRE